MNDEAITRLAALIDLLRSKGISEFEDDEYVLKMGAIPPQLSPRDSPPEPPRDTTPRDDGLTEDEARLLYESASR